MSGARGVVRHDSPRKRVRAKADLVLELADECGRAALGDDVHLWKEAAIALEEAARDYHVTKKAADAERAHQAPRPVERSSPDASVVALASRRAGGAR